MNAIVSIVIATVAVLVAVFVLPPIVRTYFKYRGKGFVTCPETKERVTVDVDAGHAAWTAGLHHSSPDLRLRDCSRWPERQDCGQECVKQIEVAPENCLVRMMIEKWYEGKSCMLCGKTFENISWMEHKPAAIAPSGETIEWRDVELEKLPEVMSTHKPVCWNCHIAETFRRRYPDLVVDRPDKASPTSSRGRR